MTRSLLRALSVSAVLALGSVAAGCGSDDDDGGGGDSAANVGAPITEPPAGAERGGTLNVISAGDVDYIDPGQTYYAFGFQVLQPTLAPLYQYPPGQPDEAEPLLAEGEPQISEDGRTITVKIKSGYRFSPPVNREATSADVKYGMERAFKRTVANGYAGGYFGNLVGAEEYQDGDADEIRGIETPDDRTIVFRTTSGGPLANALVLPITSPQPKEYAERFDRENPSTYGENQVSVGPYQVDSYTPTRRIVLTRNPNWDRERTNDPRPAYLDRIVVEQGNEDPTIASRRVLEGRSFVSGDFAPSPQIIKSTVQGARKGQIQFNPGAGNRYVALNTTLEPFDDANVRRAVGAALDRTAMRQGRGGPVIGDIPTHFIYPGNAGFEEAGGFEGPGVDWLAKPEGDLELAREYMRKAGYENGRYDGPAISVVGDNSGVQRPTNAITQRALEQLGFEVNLRELVRDTMYTRYCNVPKARVHVCPGVGWIRDFADPQTILDVTFNGENIVQQNNTNWPQLNDPALNRAMNEAKEITDPAERARAWADIDRRVTATAAGIPYLWDKYPTIASTNVAGVNALWNQGSYELSYTSLK